MISFDTYSRAQLVNLLHLKNKKIDSQRSMLYHSRERRNKLPTGNQKYSKENEKLKGEAEKLNQRIERLMAAGRGNAWVIKEYAPVIMNTLMAYFKLKRDGIIKNNELVFLI